MPQIVFVCTGNTCRSPVAEVVLRERLVAIGFHDWSVKSMGIRAIGGQPAAPHSLSLMAERGIDLSEHRSRAFDLDLVESSTLVLCMEQAQVDWIYHAYPHQRGNIFTLSDMSYRQYDVPDPYGEALDAYRKMVSDVATLIEAGLPRIIDMVERR